MKRKKIVIKRSPGNWKNYYPGADRVREQQLKRQQQKKEESEEMKAKK